MLHILKYDNIDIIPEETQVVRRIYRMFLAGKHQSLVAGILTKEGIPTPAGKNKWFYSTIDSILSNEK